MDDISTAQGDYAIRSFHETIQGLENYKDSTAKTLQTILAKISKIENYFNNDVDYDFVAVVNDTIVFGNTVVSELSEIITEIQTSVTDTHISRLKSIATTSYNLMLEFSRVWKNNEMKKAYGTAEFKVVEELYSHGTGMAIGLTDISQITDRLKDFIGRTSPNTSLASATNLSSTVFIDESRIEELKSITNPNFDLKRLIRLCEEINISVKNDCFFATGALSRAIMDHIPPIFNHANFTQVASNYGAAGTSFTKSMKNLESSMRHISDSLLHRQIKQSESLPNLTQVNCSQDLDVLLAEICRILRQ
jgi:hypothetical protein